LIIILGYWCDFIVDSELNGIWLVFIAGAITFLM